MAREGSGGGGGSKMDGRDTLNMSYPSPRPDGIAQGSGTWKIDPCYPWLQNSIGAVALEETAGFSPLKEPAQS